MVVAHLTWLNFLAAPMGSLCPPEKGPAAGLQMAVCIDKAILLPRPCNITQTLSPLPTKIHLLLRANLRIHHLDTCIETMTMMTARDGSRNNAVHVFFDGQLLSRDQFLEMKLSAGIVLAEDRFSCALYVFIQKGAAYQALVVLQG